MGVRFDIQMQLDGWMAAVADLEEVEHRVLRPLTEESAGGIFSLLETGQKIHFDKMHGRYILTGETYDSLTDRHAPGAIRDILAGGDGIEFGTVVPHAHYLTKSPKDVEDGQVTKGTHGKGRSAVLVLDRRYTAVRAAQMLLDYITAPWLEGDGEV